MQCICICIDIHFKPIICLFQTICSRCAPAQTSDLCRFYIIPSCSFRLSGCHAYGVGGEYVFRQWDRFADTSNPQHIPQLLLWQNGSICCSQSHLSSAFISLMYSDLSLILIFMKLWSSSYLTCLTYKMRNTVLLTQITKYRILHRLRISYTF